jgi:hypothetical protein
MLTNSLIVLLLLALHLWAELLEHGLLLLLVLVANEGRASAAIVRTESHTWAQKM